MSSEKKMPRNPNNLPEEILIEIFSRLPAKAVGRCRCLSKTWSCQLSTCQFIQLHLLNRSKTNQQNLLVISSDVDRSLQSIDAPTVGKSISRKLEFGISWNRVWGSCNGLVLLSDRKKELFLVNPNTLQLFELPPLSLSLRDKNIIYSQHGLGYDSLSNDYKVLCLTYFQVVRDARRCCDGFIDVYSVKSGAWKRLGTSPDCRITAICAGSFVNGAVHGYSSCKKTNSVAAYVIHAFDLADGVCHEFPAAPVSFGNISLLVHEGCLCMTHTSYSSANIEIWMLKHYGLPDSWTKFTIPANRELYIRHPLCSIGDREILFVTYDNKWVVYNLRDGTTKVMAFDVVPAAALEGMAYVDSLVSPNHQNSN